MPRGRPSKYTDELAGKLLARIAEGESSTKICKDPEMPSHSTLCLWAQGQSGAPADFPERYREARRQQAEAYFNQIIELGDDAQTAEQAAIAKTRMWARTWVLGRMNPAKYAEKTQVEVTGDPEKPVTLSVTGLANISDEERGELIDVSHRLLQGGK